MSSYFKIIDLAVLVALVFFSGCIGGEEEPVRYTCLDGGTVSSLDLCPEYETTTITVTTSTTSTTLRITKTIPQEISTTTSVFEFIPPPRTTTTIPATTTIPDTCNNGILDPGELYVDCSKNCTGCEVMGLGPNEYVYYKDTGYGFKYGGERKLLRTAVAATWPQAGSYYHRTIEVTVYDMLVQTPYGIVGNMTLNINDTVYVDHLKFTFAEDGVNTIKIYVKEDPKIDSLPSGAVVLSVGGNGCAFSTKGFCRRSFEGYEFRVLEREGDRAKFQIKLPGGSIMPGVWIDKYRLTEIGGLWVGLAHPAVRGGYSVIYVLEENPYDE